MDKGVSLLLCHEMPGIGGQKQRHAVEFDRFFACEDGSTPDALLHKGIYSSIAIPFKGGEWRHTSFMMAVFALASDPRPFVNKISHGSASATTLNYLNPFARAVS